MAKLLILTLAQAALYGIVTRETKGSPLTHEEMDNNNLIHLDLRYFSEVSWDGTMEYPAIQNAVDAPTVGQSVTVTPIEGYCALRIMDTNNLGNYPEWNNSNDGWAYHNKFSDLQSGSSGDVALANGDEYFVVRADSDVTFTMLGNVNAEEVEDVPFVMTEGDVSSFANSKTPTLMFLS